MKEIVLFRERLQVAIALRGLSQSELARRTGLTRSNICHYLRGDYECTGKNLYKMALALNVNPAWLMGLSEVMSRQEMADQKKAKLDEIQELCSEQCEEKLDTIIKVIKSLI